jgi:hypothetical protein
LLHGRLDPNVDTWYYGPMVDDGTTLGDAVAGDDVFTYDGIATNCCAEVGPRIVRVKAETQAADGLRHDTAVDVAPFAVVGEIPAGDGLTPTAALPDVVTIATAMPAAAIVPPAPKIVPPIETPFIAVTPSPAATSEAGPRAQTTPGTLSATDFVTLTRPSASWHRAPPKK